MDYKSTLSMVNTAFPMRAGLSEKEPALVAHWKDIDLYNKMNENRVDAPVFMLHDGPPYANGDIHCGHALNVSLKDFVIRYKNMAGFKTPYIPGWDTHGLPIETKVTKSGVNRKTTPIDEFREKCESYALTQVERQKAQILRLGCLGDFDHPYLTLSKEYEARQIEVFSEMALKGLIFKGLKPVYWSPSSESALAEAEVEYHDVEAKTIYVGFDIIDSKGLFDLPARFLIWTTTPWTIPTNQAVAANPLFEYGLYKTSKGTFIFLSSLKEKLKEELELGEIETLKEFKGQDLEGVKYVHPLYPERKGQLILASYVDDSAGTGLVHIAPDHGLDDFLAGAKYGIKPYCPIDEKGVFATGEGDIFNGMFYEDTNDLVIKLLNEKGLLFKRVDIVHSYPHDWRTKKPIIFRATPQWFCSIEPIRKALLDEVKKIEWVPAWGEGKMVNMIKDRADWCISRQRVWGVPLPIIYCEDNTPIMEKEVFDHIANLFREHGSSIWFKKEAKDLLPEGYRNEHSPNGLFTKEKDIMDVWFDSGSSWNGTLVERGLQYPADLYLEGNDQYRGWFNASLIVSVATHGVSPFKTCLTHGFVMDESWQKMSKSSGNGIDPNKIAQTYGADILRLWASSVDYRADARLGEGILQNAIDNYRKIRNTFRFLLGNLNGYDPKKEIKENPLIVRMIKARLGEVINRALKGYEEYDFSAVLNAVIPFLSSDLSSLFLDVSKDILYCDKKDSSRREAIVACIFDCAYSLCLLLNPILPFTMEEIYSYLPVDHKESVQLEDMVKTRELDEEGLNLYEAYLAFRGEVNKAIEEKRNQGLIGSASEAEAVISMKEGPLFKALKEDGEELLAKGLLVSKAILKEGDPCIEIRLSEAPLCARCRLHVEDAHEHEGDSLCPRCLEAIGE